MNAAAGYMCPSCGGDVVPVKYTFACTNEVDYSCLEVKQKEFCGWRGSHPYPKSIK